MLTYRDYNYFYYTIYVNFKKLIFFVIIFLLKHFLDKFNNWQ